MSLWQGFKRQDRPASAESELCAPGHNRVEEGVLYPGGTKTSEVCCWTRGSGSGDYVLLPRGGEPEEAPSIGKVRLAIRLLDWIETEHARRS